MDTRPGGDFLNLYSIALFALANELNALNYYRLSAEQLEALKDIEWKLLTDSVPGPY